AVEKPVAGDKCAHWDVCPEHLLFQEAPSLWLWAAWRQGRAKERSRQLRAMTAPIVVSSERRAQTMRKYHCWLSARAPPIAALPGTRAHRATPDFRDRAPRPRCVSKH